MGFRSMLGGNPGRSFAGVLAVAAVVAFAAQGAIGAPSDKKPKETRRTGGQGQQASGTQQKPATRADQQVTRNVGGVQVKIDPATGRMQQPTAQEAVMATVSPKGKVTMRCVNDAAQAARILAGEPINDGAAAMSRTEAKRATLKSRGAGAEKE